MTKTYQDTKAKKLEIKKLEVQYKEASQNTADLLEQLSARATILEKTKAMYTEASNSLSAFLQMNEVESEEEVEDELLMDGKWFAIRSEVRGHNPCAQRLATA